MLAPWCGLGGGGPPRADADIADAGAGAEPAWTRMRGLLPADATAGAGMWNRPELLTGGNRHDSIMLAATLDAIPPVCSGKRGRPRRRPHKLHADKAYYDSRRCRAKCRARGIQPRIARKGVDSSQRLERHRWIVERTHAWMARLRRLAVRYERRADIHLAFTLLGCALVRMNQIKRFC